MSYNYLPLDRKWLNFQQVKNLLDYDQLVSITFDAHERILKCNEYLDQKQVEVADNFNNLSSPTSVVEVPLPVLKLMLMLKIKSLSYGHSGVKIETVKRLMEMYNNGVFPVINTYGVNSELTPLDSLCFSLIDKAEVSFAGKKRSFSEVAFELGWETLTLNSIEQKAISSGSQFYTAVGLYALKKAEQLLKIADIVAALSVSICNYNAGAFYKGIVKINKSKGAAETAAFMVACVERDEFEKSVIESTELPSLFKSIPAVHGAAKDAFDYFLDKILKEINTTSEETVIFPHEDLIITEVPDNSHLFSLVANYFANSISGVAKISFQRIQSLLDNETNLFNDVTEGIRNNQHIEKNEKIAFDTFRWNEELVSKLNSSLNQKKDFPEKCPTSIDILDYMQIVENAEKVIAIESIIIMQYVQRVKPVVSSAILNKFIEDFNNNVAGTFEEAIPGGAIDKAIEFISFYKF